MPGRTFRTAVSTLLAGVFLLSLGAEAFGWHDCPHHHREARADAASQASDASAEAAGAERPGIHRIGQESRTGPRQHESGPCTCVGNCHGAAASPVPAVLPGVPAVLHEVARIGPRPDTGGLPLRLGSYFLPYPNGPPPA